MKIQTYIIFGVFSMTCAAALGQEIINVFLIGGQSNALGRADIATDDPLLANNAAANGIAGNSMLYHYNYRVETLAEDGFANLEPRSESDGQNGNFGMELTFGRDIQKALGGQQVAILKYAVGGTNLYSQWYGDGTVDNAGDGPIYSGFKTFMFGALSQLQSDNPDAEIRIRAMLWHQGENDCLTEEAASAYEVNLTNFIKDVRLTFNQPDLPFMIGGLNDLWLNAKSSQDISQYIAVVRQAQEDVAAADPNAWFVNLDSQYGLTMAADEIHFTVDGYKKMGELFAEQVALNVVPEPSTLGLAIFSLLGLVGFKK